MVAKITGAQRDFSYGEVDTALKRADEHPARKAGLRQMANARILNSGAVQNRSGRRALFPTTAGRVEKITMSAGNNFKIALGAHSVQIRSDAGVVLQTFTLQGGGAALPWASQADINLIRYTIFGLSIYICFGHAMRPQVITWDGVATWTIADYTELSVGAQKRTLFYRISPQNITLLPSSALVGAITLTASAPLFTAGWVGTRVRYINRQIFITGFTDSEHVSASVQESLPGSQEIGFGVAVAGLFSLGDELIGGTSGSKGIVTSFDLSNNTQLTVQLLTSNNVVSAGPGVTASFIEGEIVSGPGGSSVTNSLIAIGNPAAVTLWDNEVMNDFQGYPASCFTDQFRLGFCNFPAVPGGIGWSAINSPTDIYVGADPADAMLEIAPGKVQIFDVVAGPESSEFVFCDTKLYYIPISPTNPLKPGSVQFQVLSSDGCANVQPKVSQEIILYANAGANSMMAIVASGAYYRPFNTKNLSEFHAHLFNGITTIAVPTADGTFNERYAYVMNGNGSIVVGKYSLDDVTAALPKIGWGPWSGAGAVSWVSAWTSDVYFTSSYFGVGICEVLDDTQYLDCAINVNAPTAPFTPPVGKGPLWFIPSQNVTLMDQVTRAMGTYQIDANGFIVPQNNGGANLAVASLVAGQPWTGIIEPFCPDANPGTDVGQRMFKRRVSRFAAYVENSTGFLMARLFSGPITPATQAAGIVLGTIMNTHRVTTWNQGDDATKPPPLRETAERWRPIGRAFDPRVAIVKDTPGPLLIAELGIECTI